MDSVATANHGTGEALDIFGLTVQLSSQDPDRLRAFYIDVVGLQVDERDGLKLGPARLRFNFHSEITGENVDPARFMLNIFVGDIAAEEARLKEGGVPVIRSAEREDWGGLVATFADPDGNFFQLIELPVGQPQNS